MFDQYQDQLKEKPDPWFYPTIIAAVFTVVAVAVLALNYSDLIFVSSLFSRGRKIEGEIAVVTKEQKSVKLGSIKVCAIREEKILGWISSKNEKAEAEGKKAKLKLDYARYNKRAAERDHQAAQSVDERSKAESVQSDKTSRLDKAEAEYRYWFSPAFYFSGLKECDAQAVTDRDGKFSLTLNQGKYALAAQAEKDVTNLNEEYFWLIWVGPEASDKPVRLTNDNRMAANPPEKVVEIKDL